MEYRRKQNQECSAIKLTHKFDIHAELSGRQLKMWLWSLVEKLRLRGIRKVTQILNSMDEENLKKWGKKTFIHLFTGINRLPIIYQSFFFLLAVLGFLTQGLVLHCLRSLLRTVWWIARRQLAHAYNLSYMGSWIRKDHGSRTTQTKKSVRPLSQWQKAGHGGMNLLSQLQQKA
jgi:hypothetical protein